MSTPKQEQQSPVTKNREIFELLQQLDDFEKDCLDISSESEAEQDLIKESTITDFEIISQVDLEKEIALKEQEKKNQVGTTIIVQPLPKIKALRCDDDIDPHFNNHQRIHVVMKSNYDDEFKQIQVKQDEIVSRLIHLEQLVSKLHGNKDDNMTKKDDEYNIRHQFINNMKILDQNQQNIQNKIDSLKSQLIPQLDTINHRHHYPRHPEPIFRSPPHHRGPITTMPIKINPPIRHAYTCQPRLFRDVCQKDEDNDNKDEPIIKIQPYPERKHAILRSSPANDEIIITTPQTPKDEGKRPTITRTAFITMNCTQKPTDDRIFA